MMPGGWGGWRGSLPGPAGPGGMASITPSARAPQKSDQSAAQRSFNLIPNQPTPQEIGATIEHLTQRPANPAEVAQVMEDTAYTYGDYAPGGQISQTGSNQISAPTPGGNAVR